MYKPFKIFSCFFKEISNIFLIITFLFLFSSCIPQTKQKTVSHSIVNKTNDEISSTVTNPVENPKVIEIIDNNLESNNQDLSKKIHVILSNKKEHQYTSKSFLNALEMATFDIGNESLTFEISTYINDEDLNNLFMQKSKEGQIFIGPLTSKDTMLVKKFCKNNIIVFAFASNRDLAGDCIYLFNFFIEDDLKKIFSYLNKNNKVALLYPNNEYGKYVSSIIDDFSKNSEATLIYKIPYKEDLTNSRSVIKQIGKYDFRKNELEKQKKLLKERNDEISLASLKKLEKFETIGDLDFNTLIISDGNIRILELAPLLPFYDIDPKQVQFIGTGLWDEKSYFDEPSLQGSIFPGIEEIKRKQFIDNYINIYKIPPERISTIMYDLAALTNYLSKNYNNVEEIKNLLNNENFFHGIDGQFSMKNNLIERNLSMLKIKDGKAESIN